MSILTEHVRFEDHVGTLAWPERAQLPLPGVVVIPEVWGVDGHIEDVTRRIAAAGYAALAPDIYAPGGVRPEALSLARIAEMQGFMGSLPRNAWMDEQARGLALQAQGPEKAARIGETMGMLWGGMGRRSAEFVETLRAGVRYLRTSAPQSQGQKVASVGFCMGGALSALLACEEPAVSGAVVFYGSSPALELVPHVACPVLGLYAGLDERINGGVPAFAQAMKGAGKSFEFHTYEGASHGFFNDGRESYHVRAARDAFVRTLDFFQRQLAS